MVNATLTPEHNLATTYNGVEYIYNLGDMAWIIVATGLVFIMIPGLAFFYAGLGRAKSATSMLWMGSIVMAMAMFTWSFWGFSLAFSRSGNKYIRNLDHFGLMGVDIQPSTGSNAIPQLLYYAYQMMFAAITPVIAAGAFIDRARLAPVILWTFCWSTIVYAPIACWTWNLGDTTVDPPIPGGWAAVMGGLDFAGGTPVHISSGTAALAISIFLGRRKGYGTELLAYRPHNVFYVVIGTVLLWFGWFGFNGGSALGANLRAVMAMTVTNNAAAVGGLTWMFWDWRLERKWSLVGFCSGAIAGLVAITPASGYVAWPASIAFGVVAGTLCNFATGLKNLIGVDDTLDIFAAHGVGGIIGNIMTAFFADNRVASFDGSALIGGGWINHNWIQLGYQLADSVSGFAYSFVMTMILLFLIDRIPGFHFRATDEDEVLGIDLAQTGEQCVVFPDHFIDSNSEAVNSGLAKDAHSSPSTSVHASDPEKMAVAHAEQN
jgi:ammonium transporter, Amt family